MVKVVISGYGKMGHMIESVISQSEGVTLALATEDIQAVDPVLAKECVCIDFTTPAAFHQNYEFIASHFAAAVVGTTGWNDIKPQVLECFRQHGTTLIYGSNFSIGVNAFFAACERVSQLLSGNGYAASITEVHHIHKLDAPSGTAKTLGEIVGGALGVAEVPIESIREGEVPGIHTLKLQGGCDSLTFTHEAASREGFARGAVYAATVCGENPGVHEFREIFLK